MSIIISKIICDKCRNTEQDTKGRDYYCKNCGAKMSDEKIQKELKFTFEKYQATNDNSKAICSIGVILGVLNNPDTPGLDLLFIDKK